MHRGWVRLWRCIQDSWQWQNEKHLKIWLWLIMNANYQDTGDLKRGQVRTTVRQIARATGLSKDCVARFLRRCERENDILWERGSLNPPNKRSGATVSATEGATVSATGDASVSVDDYEYYQGNDVLPATVGATEGATDSATLLKKKKEKKEVQEKKKKEKEEEERPSGRLPKQEQLKQIQESFPEFQEQFPFRNVPQVYEQWLDWLAEKGKRPSNYKASFRNFLRPKDWEKNLKAQIEGSPTHGRKTMSQWIKEHSE